MGELYGYFTLFYTLDYPYSSYPPIYYYLIREKSSIFTYIFKGLRLLD